MYLYRRVAVFNFGTYLTYPFDLLGAALRPLIDLGFRLLFWTIVATSSHGALQIKGLVAYFLIATGISSLTLMSDIQFGSYLAKGIKYGKLSYALVKPVNPLFFELSELLGNMGVTFCISLLFVAIGLIIQPPSSLLSVALFLAYVPLALAISYGTNVLVGSVAFYFTEVRSFKNAVSHVVNVFSGALVPLSLFTGALKTIVIALPFATAVYGPVQALRTTHMSSLTWLSLGSGVFWAIVLVLMANYLWKLGLKHYEAVGI